MTRHCTIAAPLPTVLVVDDHTSFRTNARRVLEAEGYDVVGEAADGESAVREALALDPDVVVLDIQLPDIDGFEVAARLASAGSRAAVVLVSARPWTDFRSQMDGPSVCPFVAKADLSGAALAAALHSPR